MGVNDRQKVRGGSVNGNRGRSAGDEIPQEEERHRGRNRWILLVGRTGIEPVTS